MIYILDVTAAEDWEYNPKDETSVKDFCSWCVRTFPDIHEATEELLKDYYEVRSDYGDPIGTILREVTEAGKRKLLTDFHYIIGSSERDALDQWEDYLKSEPYKVENKDDALVTVPSSPCVIITHSFSIEGTQVYEYDSCEEAQEGLKRFYNLYLAEERANNSKLDEAETYSDDEGYAKITWEGEAGDKTEFIISCIWREV